MRSIVLRILRLIGLFFASMAALVTLLVASMYLEHFLPTDLPAPTGPYDVGRTSYLFAKGAEPYALNDREGEDLVVWIWYPALLQSNSAPADYFPAPWLKAVNESWAWAMTHVFTRDLSKVRVHSASDARISAARATYPVLVMRTGGSALTLQYSTLAEDLASRGYVVVGFDAPYRTQLVVLPNGEVKHRSPQNDPEQVPLPQVERLLMMWVNDVRFVLDRLQVLNEHDDRSLLTHRLDLKRVGVFGHSFGGAQALQVCHDDSRCKAAIDIDGLVFGSVSADGLKQPTMFLMGDHHLDHYFAPKPESQLARNFHAVYRRLPANDRAAVMIEGADHFSFADGGVVRSHVLLSLFRAGGLVIDGHRQLVMTSICVSAFFGKYLNDEAGGFDNCTQLEGVKPSTLVVEGK